MVAKTDRGKFCEQEIIRNYLEVQEHYQKQGVLGYMTRQKVYDDVADRLGYSTARVKAVILEYMKGLINFKQNVVV